MKQPPARLKWHMLRRRKSDPGHLRANLEQALRAGAACEVDLHFTSDGHAFCLHDDTLDRETTGRGPAAPLQRVEIERLCQRGADGMPLESPPLFLDEVVDAVRRFSRADGGLVQLDVKAPVAELDKAGLERMAAVIGETAPRFIAGACNWQTAKRLAAAIPGMKAGFDPLDFYPRTLPPDAQAYRALGERTLATAPDAAMFYLEARLVLGGLTMGINLVEMTSCNGARVDAWTVDANRPDLRADLEKLVRAGVHQVTSNDPDILAPLLQDIAACL
jgi:glycerophosphoryl diester phosphodiesterase